MSSGLRIEGHPIHPMLVGFPVVLYVTALVGDVGYLIAGNIVWYQVAYVAMGLGLIFALVAAIAGAFEYATIPRRVDAKRTATFHALLNLGVWGLFLVNFLSRSAVPGTIGLPQEALAGTTLYGAVFLTVLGVALTASAGWLGWHLVYGHGVGISQRAADTRHVSQARVPTQPWHHQEGETPSRRDEAH